MGTGKIFSIKMRKYLGAEDHIGGKEGGPRIEDIVGCDRFIRR